MNYNCIYCKYSSNKLFNTNRHIQTKHNKNEEESIIIEKQEEVKNNEYIYLIQEREFIKTNEHIYKIGKTKQPCLKRLYNYPNGTTLILQILCNDCDTYEKILIIKFKQLFIHKKNIGNEYFMGDYNEMINIIYELIYNKDIKKDIKNKEENVNKCSKCNKILSSKNYLKKHSLVCKGVSNPLECHYCHKIYSNTSSKSQHLKICKERPNNIIL